MKKTLSLFLACAILLTPLMSVSAAETQAKSPSKDDPVATTDTPTETPDTPDTPDTPSETPDTPDKPEPDNTVTYYFLAPDDYFAANSDVGYYYWQPEQIAPWPGAKATPAPEVGLNVFKIECPDMDSTSTIIFNAYVDAGNPADPELAAVAHQTVNINVEGYEAGESAAYPDGLDNFYGMIYVLANDEEHRQVNEFSGAATTSGEWFSINPEDDNYYRNSENYKTYGFKNYYFLAPQDYLATNNDVGYYYWQPEQIAPWPGAKAIPAPEVGLNVYKMESRDLDSTPTIIFDAYVDAGNPADPELAAVAHQTVNINVEGYEAGESDVYPDGLDNFYDMIYVLANDEEHRQVNEFSGAVTTSGEWFSINPEDDNYYRNSDNYKTYGFVTYYFLAPDSYFATNNDVGYYYWQPNQIAPWPGAKASPAPEIGENVVKIECLDMDSTATIIFNAYVDAGNPADPELAAVAHQTVNINVEGYEEGESDVYPDGLDNFYGMIYVLANDEEHQSVNEFSGAVTTSGEWFSVDSSADNYYKNSENYKTYNFDVTPPVKTEPDVITPDTSDETEYKAGDEVTVEFLLGGISNLGAVNATLTYNADLLTIDPDYAELSDINESSYAKAANAATAGVIQISAYFDPENGTDDYKGEPTALFTFKFTANKDFKKADLNVQSVITYLLQVYSDGSDVIIRNSTSDAILPEDTYSSLTLSVKTPEKPAPTVIIGDVDKDETVTSNDALEVLRNVVGLNTFDAEQAIAADVNGDKSIDSADALFILRYVVGYHDADTLFPAE